MNKKQLIVVWIMGIIICLAWLVWGTSQSLGGGYVGEYGRYPLPKPDKKATLIVTHVITIIIGGLLIYTLRKKK